jgi:flavin-dependent dehydrogenase
VEGGYLLANSKKEVIAKAKYVILSNGFNSALRNQLGIKMGDGKEFYRLVNIHFKSAKLASAIKAKNCEAMLHFVYN